MATTTTTKQELKLNWFDKFVLEVKYLIPENKKVERVINLFEKYEEKGRDNLTNEEVEKLEKAISAIRLSKKEEFILFSFYESKSKMLQEVAEMTGYVQHNFNKKLKLYKNKERELRPELGPYLKSLRKNMGMTLEDVKNLSNSNISVSYISRIENTSRPSPSLSLLKDLANIYQTPLNEVLEVAGIPLEMDTEDKTNKAYEIDDLFYKFKLTYKGNEIPKNKKESILSMFHMLMESSKENVEKTVQMLNILNTTK